MRGKLYVIDGIDGSGKTTLAKKLVSYLKQEQPTWYISISDCVKQGVSNSIIEHNELPTHVASNQMSREDIPKELQDIFNINTVTRIDTAAKAVREILLDLENVHSVIATDSNIHYVKAYHYNRLLEAYLNVMIEATEMFNKILDSGINIVADRWFSSTLAYNGIVRKTYISKAIKYFKKYYYRKADIRTPYYLYDRVCFKKITVNKEHDHVYKDRYKDTMQYLASQLDKIVKPDLEFIFLLDPNVALERIAANRPSKDVVFEDKDKLERVFSVYQRLNTDIDNLTYVKDKDKYKPVELLCDSYPRRFLDIRPHHDIAHIFNSIKREL